MASEEGIPHSRAPAFHTFPAYNRRHFLRGVTLDPHGSGLGCGPCPKMVFGLTAKVLVSKATLCSVFTIYRSSGHSPSSRLQILANLLLME